MRWLLVVLAVASSACVAPHSVGWEPYSVRMNGKQIAARAIEIAEGDIGLIRSAGGLPAGTLTTRGHASPAEMAEVVGKDAAEYGGTHFILGSFRRDGDGWAIGPSEKKGRPTYAVIRVPASGWRRLPAGLTPEAVGGGE